MMDVLSGAGLTFLFMAIADWVGTALGSLPVAVFLSAMAFYAAGFVSARLVLALRPINVGFGAACTVVVTCLARLSWMRSGASAASVGQIALFIAILGFTALLLAWLGARFALLLRARRMSDSSA